MENDRNAPITDDALSCYCWKCYIQAELVQDFDVVQEYRCPKCCVRIRLGNAELFDPLRSRDDDTDSVSVCVSPDGSRRSTITYSGSEASASDDIENRPLTPENFDLLATQIPPVPTNTPADKDDVPDAPPNIAKAFADVTKFLLNVPTPKRYSCGNLSAANDSESISPSKMITNVVQAYQRRSLNLHGSDEPMSSRVDQSTGIEIRITPSTDIENNNSKVITRKVSASEIRIENAESGNPLNYKRD